MTNVIRANMYFPSECCLIRQSGANNMCLFLLETVKSASNINIIIRQRIIIAIQINYLVYFPIANKNGKAFILRYDILAYLMEKLEKKKMCPTLYVLVLIIILLVFFSKKGIIGFRKKQNIIFVVMYTRIFL